jgi:Xaa-Pro dipeptidase
MALHFEVSEFEDRRRRSCRAIAEQKLDGLLIFRQESMYWLTGYDTSGYSMFQGMYLGADGSLALLTRSADRLQSRLTSILKDIRIWVDRAGSNPAIDLRDMLESYGCCGKRIGVEYHAYGLTAQRGKLVDAALDGFCAVEDASDLIRLLRLVKSPAELTCFRHAGALVDETLGIAREMTVPGAHTGAIYGEMMSAVMRGDGDPSASRWPLGAGEEALMVRYHTGHGTIAAQDQVQFEIAASYRHYHAALMYVILTGVSDARQQKMFDACVAALHACLDVLRPGRTVGEVFDAHARAFIKFGYGESYLNVCGYTMGATYPPTWMDYPMIHTGNPQILEPNMVFFTHMILLDAKTGLSMSLGQTSRVTEGACEPLSRAPTTLIVN